MAIFKKSAMELRSVRCLCVTALLIALELALKFATQTIMPDLKVSFAFLGKASIGMLYGPAVSFFAGIVSDIISFFLKPQSASFSLLFTLQEGLAGMLYGLFLYKLKLSRAELRDKTLQKQSAKQIFRIILAKLSVVVLINLIYTPLALIITQSMEAGTLVFGSVLTKYPARLIKNAVQFPVDCALLIAVLPVVATAYYLVFKGNNNNNNKIGFSGEL